MSDTAYATRNLLVPAAGTTRCVVSSGTASANPIYVSFGNVDFEGQPFSPQAAIVDNTGSSSAVSIKILPIGYTIVVPAGVVQSVQFPAPAGLSAAITGGGNFLVYWVDYPIFPNNSVVQVSGGTVQATLAPGSTVAIPQTTGTGPYLQTQVPTTATLGAASITTATTATIATVVGANLRRLRISISGDASLAAAGRTTITVTNNAGATITKFSIFVPGTAGTTQALLLDHLDVFDASDMSADTSVTITLSTALATGQLDFQIWYD